MVFHHNIRITNSSNANSNSNSNSYNLKTESKTESKTELNAKSNIIYNLYYPQNEEERWIVKQIKKLYSKLLIAHFNILKINANQRKELYEELLTKYKKFFGKDFIPEEEEEFDNFNFNNNYNFDNNYSNNYSNNFNNKFNANNNNDNNSDIKKITIKNSIQSYVEDSDEEDSNGEDSNGEDSNVEDSNDEEAYCEHCDGPIDLIDTEMCECFGHPYCCDECSVPSPDENDSDRYCILCVPTSENDEDDENKNINPMISSSNSENQLSEVELRKILGIELNSGSNKDSRISEELPPPYSSIDITSNTDNNISSNNISSNIISSNNILLNNKDIIAKEA